MNRYAVTLSLISLNDKNVLFGGIVEAEDEDFAVLKTKKELNKHEKGQGFKIIGNLVIKI